MRYLLATTALACFMAVPAQAEMTVKVGGYTAVQAALFDNDTANGSTRDFLSESEVHVKVTNTADNGLEYGAYIELQTSTSDTVKADEANLFLQAGWGRLELGDQDGAGSVMTVYAPYVGAGQVAGSYMDFVPAADRGYRPSEGPGDPFFKALDTSDATKITYYTPKFSGFQAGVSYAPERDNASDGEQVQFSSSTGNHDNAYEIALAYAGTFNDVSMKLGGEYNGAPAKSGSGLEDISAWALGAQLGYNGFTLGGGYKHDGDSGQSTGTANDSVTGWNLGLTYESGAWGVGASYVNIDFDSAASVFEVTGATGSGGDYSAYGAGATYKLAPGLSASADLMFFDRNRNVGADSDGYVLLTEVRAAF